MSQVCNAGFHRTSFSLRKCSSLYDGVRLKFLNFSMTRHLWASERDVIQVKKVTYFGGFCYPNNLVLKKGIAVMYMSFTRGEFTLSK